MQFGERYTRNKMDEYDKKFAEMQKYIPFLEAMIERLQNVKDKSREIQLQKMQSLHGILSNSKRKLKIETLQRCEDVLQKLHNKVEKGNTPGLHFPNKKGEMNSVQPLTIPEKANVDQNKMKQQQVKEVIEENEIHETPASPSPPVSPDSGSQAAPIIIPTERSLDFVDDKSDSKPASPDLVETVPTKAPIIIPTERTNNALVLSSNFSSSKTLDEVSFSEWEMLEESEQQNARNKSWQPHGPSSHDTTSTAKLAGNNLPPKVNEGRPHVPVPLRHIPTIPIPSLGSCRRLSSVLEKNRLPGINIDATSSDSRPESPTSVSDVRLKSPDSEMLFQKHKSTSPRLKDGHGNAKASSKPPAPLLLSPPPVSTEPPLSMEDLAELLSEENDGKSEKKNEKFNEEALKFKKDTNKQEQSTTGIGGKDTKASKPFLLTQDDIDRESERRWEEIDKHIVKLTSRKCLPSVVTATSTTVKADSVKSNEIKGPKPSHSMYNSNCYSMNAEKVVDNRNRPSSPSSKMEPRYADNYERHPRQSRDSHSHDNFKDKVNTNVHCRVSDDDMANPIPVHHAGSNKLDDRNATMYPRRQVNVGPDIVPPRIETEFRMEGPDYFNRPMPNANHWPPIHPPVNNSEFCNNQWPAPNNFGGIPNSSAQPIPYQHPMGMHQDMWNMGTPSNPIHMDPHPNDAQLRSNQFPPNMNTSIRPLMSPTARPPDICHNPRPDNIREDLPNMNVSAIQPLISPTGFPVGPQYRNFQGENRPYEPVFDRGMEYPHARQSWDSQPGRTNDVPYRGETEVPCGIINADSPAGPSAPYSRPSTPCPWNRDRDRCNRGRGRDTFYNDRNRGEIRSNFNRDARRSEWSRDGHGERDNCNRFNRDARNLSERDPRVRMEHNVANQNQNQLRDNNCTSARDPRLAKDKHPPIAKNKDPVYNERDPRKRQVPPPLAQSPRKGKEKLKSPPKSSDNHRRPDSESSGKHAQDKLAKDKMQSPLESLYGVIDTKAKSAQGYCLQNFKIPKIKRTEPSESPTPSNISEEVKSSSENKLNTDKQEGKTSKNEVECQREKQSTEKDGTIAEVSSSSDSNILLENWNGDDTISEKKEDTKEETPLLESTDNVDKNNVKIGEADSITVPCPKSSETSEIPKKEDSKVDGAKSKEEVTQEWIESLIRKSFEFGEGKRFVEQAKLMQKLGEVLQAKKLKKIKKIIDSETESSSSSDKDETLDSKKTRVKRKRRIIVSDSSDEESLAERLGILNTTTNKEELEDSSTSKNDANKDTPVKDSSTTNVDESKDDTVKEECSTAQKTQDTVQTITSVKEETCIKEKETTEVKNEEESKDKEVSKLGEELKKEEEVKHEEVSKPEKLPEHEEVPKREEILKQEEPSKQEEQPKQEEESKPEKKLKEEPKHPEELKDAASKNEPIDDADNVSKVPKAKAKRRNSLEMLQEDIREMFISEGVVTATGHRQCRVQKENQTNVGTTSTNLSTPISKKDDVPIKRDAEVNSDSEEPTVTPVKPKRTPKSRGTDESNKSKCKPKKEVQRITRQRSKQYAESSDSEEDQPLALRTEIIQNSSILSNQEKTDTCSEETDVLRRSTRVLGKDAIKEPRVVVEKTDITKLECSKVMFDSSSDESFGIDVSELAAAVDISLHPEKQSESITPSTVERRKRDKSISKKSSKKKKKQPTSETKGDDASLTDAESIVSDISMSSSVTSGKKMNIGTSKVETTNEELLSNILVGLVPTKTDPGKEESVADKGSDADVDDDVADQLPMEQNTKKGSSKKKKKKCNWQMGILSKKKRRRTATSSSPKIDTELNTTLDTDSSMKIDNSPPLEDAGNDGMEVASFDKTGEASNEKPDNNIKDTCVSSDDIQNAEKTTDPLRTCDSPANSKESLCKVPSTPKEDLAGVKDVQDVPSSLSSNNIVEKSVTKSKEDAYDEITEKAFSNLNIKTLMDYAWTGKERYKCLLCLFTGKNIVHHYKLNHPGKEILISRLRATDAHLAIQDAKERNVEAVPMELLPEETCKFHCRFCSFFIEGTMKVAVEAFYEHCTTHTGEYRFECKHCCYQSVAKSSMRTHYYKNCRLLNFDSFGEAVTEDEVPKENSVYGYLCSNCNYVQLKKTNVQKHLEFWHQNDSNTTIVKINMSVDKVKEGTAAVSADEQMKVVSPLTTETQEVTIRDNTGNADKSHVDEDIRQEQVNSKEKCAVADEKAHDCNPTEPETKVEQVTAACDNDESQISLQADPEVPLPTGKLSVFVCPPELEKKEVEIQLERKRKMQEIIENIGIKLQKDTTKKGLSIIDKLKDKMKSNLPAGSTQNEHDVDMDSCTKTSPNRIASASPVLSRTSNVEILHTNPEVTLIEDSEVSSSSCQDNLITDKRTDDTTIISLQVPNAECDSQTAMQADKLDTKVRDPLMIVERKKNYDSELETSDNENMRVSVPVYESDSSSEQSDSELPTDVNTLLKETSNIAASSKDPMITTIQRLAAQLQATKPLEIRNPGSSRKPRAVITQISPATSIPKPPNVVPIANIKRFVGKLETRYHEVSSEMQDDTNPPKNFIRLRRLSGDKLSVPVQSSSIQEDVSPFNDGDQSNAANRMETILHTGDEECSFLKIENVVSLAPRADNNVTESPIINDIRKAVETSPVKSKGVSVLKKSNSPLILKRLNTVTITQPMSKNMQTIQPSNSETVKLIPVKSLPSSSASITTTHLATNFVPIAPKSKIIQLDNKLSFPLSVNKTSVIAPVTTRTVTVTGSSTSSNLNYKIVKVVRTPTIIKPKEAVSQPTAIKLKSADAYNVMLKSVKLIHLYKCMARDCRFTTDIPGHYQQHYLQHAADAEKRKSAAPFDYQKCAYCYMVLDDWNQMKIHIEEKHAHCRYQCKYCFYRAISLSYVQIHQTMSHPGYHGILFGKFVKDPPTKEEINRHDYIHPFVCQHECGKFFYVPEAFTAHLKTKHGSGLSVLKCHLCRATCMKAEQLVSHYKMHGLYKYQCLYCLNGSDTYNNMFIHLSTFHCNRLPQILERSLPPQPVRSKDVIDQLLVRTVDEKNFKNNDYVIEVDSDKKDSKESIVIDVLSSSPSHKTASPSLPKEITVLDKDEQTSLEKSVSKLRDLNGNSNISPNAKSINTVLKQSDKPSENESCGDTSTNKAFGNINSESKNLGTSISNKQCPDNSLTKSAKSIASFFPSENLEESVEFSGGFDCSDEFVNINLLDNPDFFKNVSNHSSDASSVKNITALIENKNDDSDIEIVDIDDAESNTATDMKTVVDVNKENSFNMNEKSSDRISNQKADVENNKVSSSGTDNKSTLDETHENSSNTVVAKSDVPLTLEDIKDTGFTGRKLYKCGYESCNFGASTAALLRIHVKECLLRSDSKNLNCAHCNKRFVKIGFLLEHLKLHGLKRFGCSLCKMRCTVGYQAMAHMKAKHKFPTSKLVPADPKNPSADGLFIVQPVNQTGERKGKKRKRTKSIEKDCEKIDTEKLSFSPDEIELLPRQAIYNREVQCAVCPYTTKVRTNIVRHLQLHAKDESVPESGPVNPVPCLDKKERMFDKMVNLASSSHQNGRMGGKVKEVPKDSDDELIPKFVPEHKRYVCGVAECNYLTVDEAMLRYHLKALHSEEPYFRCPHCPQPPPGQESLNIAIDKMGVHLKMHDTRLYKCSHCNHHHYHSNKFLIRHVVERHLTDKHPEKRPFVKVIRELESTENNQQTVQDEVEEEVPDPDGNHWKCNICEYKCVYKAEMVNHASTAHDEKCQFKCTLCSFKTSGKIMFEQHINSKHSNDATVDYIMIYQRIKGVNKKSTDTVEQSTQEEPFDTTPLWRRDMPRIRHIRGILLEEENETESSLKPTKRKSEVELPPVKPAKVKSGKPGSLDDTRQSKEKSKRSLSCEQITVESENSCETLNTQKKSDSDAVKDKLPKESKLQSAEDNESDEWGGGRFGPYGKPDGNMYVCTLCTQFKSKYKHDMRDHLYRELNYARWHCKECGYLSVNRNALLKHFTKHHPGEHPDHEPLSPDHDIEDWVSTLLKKQTCIIKATISKQNNNSKDPSMTSSTAALTSTDNDKSSTTKDTQSSTNKYVKTIDLTPKPTNLRDNSLQGTEINIDVHDDDSKDNETITNDPKEESPLKKEKSQSIAELEKGTSILEVNQEKPLTCKHCKMIFSRWRGFKLHVQLTHLKRLGFLCPYCDRSTNSETLMRQHIRSKHPGCVEKIVQNPAAGGPELTDDFWQKEYGIVFPKKSSKKRKRRASGEDNNADNENNCDQSELQEKCTLCAFKAMNLTGLKAHMRIHTTKNNLKCTYCTFTATMKSELWDHWEVNHPFTTFKLEDTTIPGSSDESGSAQNEQKYTIDDYSDDIEEESVPDIRDDLTYCCFYCSLRSKSLEVVRNHWSVVHKESKLLSDPSKLKPNLPFRYKELLSSKSSSQNPAKKAPCPKKDTEHPYDLYLQHSQNEVQMIDASGTNQEEGWVCQWCNELCDSETNMKAHQNMFHSHLPLNFKKQGSDEAPKGYACPECSFTTTFINIMKTHVSKHINLFKCKYCDKTFSTPSHVSSHNVEKHPELELKIESIQNYDVLIDKIMAKVKWYKSVDEMDRRDTVPAKTPKNHAVAKKSTARSTVLASSIPSKVKAVARKSTNPYSRHLSNLKLNESDKSTQKFTTNKQFSYYGAPKTSINLTRLNTYMVVGGHRMKVNCTTLAQLININPKVVLKDLKHDIKNIPSLSQLK